MLSYHRPWSFPEASQFIQPPSRSAGSRQVAKVAKTNKFDVSACGETTSGKLGVLGVLAVKNAAYAVLQEKTMGHRQLQLECSGSRRKFFNPATKRVAIFHRRHPVDTLLPYQVKDALNFLKQEGVI